MRYPKRLLTVILALSVLASLLMPAAATSYLPLTSEQAKSAIAQSDDNAISCGYSITLDAKGGIRSFTFTPNVSGKYYFSSLVNEVDVCGAVYSEDGSLIYSDDNSGGNGNFQVEWTAEAGQTYTLTTQPCDLSSTGTYRIQLTDYLAASCLVFSQEEISGEFHSWTSLTVQALPEGARIPKVSMSSSDTTVATVNYRGTVTLLSEGTATIRATAASGLVAECTVISMTPPEICCGDSITIDGTQGTRRFSFIPEQTGWYRFRSTRDGGDPTIKLWNTQGEQITLGYDESGLNFRIEEMLTAGEIYILEVWSDNDRGSFLLHAEQIPQATGITLNKTACSLYTASTTRLNVTHQPDGSVPLTLTWTSSDETVATVDEDGYVKARKPGTAVITVTAETGLIQQCSVTVLEPETIALNEPLPVTPIENSFVCSFIPTEDGWYSFRSISADGDHIACLLDGETGYGLEYSSGSSTGFVLPYKLTAGKLYHLHVEFYRYHPQASCTVTINKMVAATSMELTANKTARYPGEYQILNPVFLPENSISERITWSSSDETVATVRHGWVDLLSVGTAVITAVSENGLTADFTITVEDFPRLYCDQPVELTAKDVDVYYMFTPETDGWYGFYSSGDVALDANLTDMETGKQWYDNDAHETSTFLIRQELKAGRNYLLNCEFSSQDVKAPNTICVRKLTAAEQVVLDDETVYAFECTSFSPKYQLFPHPAMDQAVSWSSSDENIVTTDEDGEPFAVSPGTAQLTLTTEAGLTDTVTVEVLSVSDDCAGCGRCGANMLWQISSDGVLTITGTGAMSHGSGQFYLSFNQVELSEGITTIGAYAFAYAEATAVTIPASVKEIFNYAFWNCDLSEIRFQGSAPAFQNNTFLEVFATAYYPAGDPSWTEEVRQNYGGHITWVPYGEATGSTVSGSVSCATGDVTMELLQGDTVVATITASGSYSFENLPDGEYTLKISKKNHVTREYTLTADTKTLDVQLCLLGDVNGDGRVNIGDTARTYSHVKQTATLGDDYALDCADSNGDGRVNIGDTARLYSHVKQTSTLW